MERTKEKMQVWEVLVCSRENVGVYVLWHSAHRSHIEAVVDVVPLGCSLVSTLILA